MTKASAAAELNRLMREAEAHFVADRLSAARRTLDQILRAVPSHPAVLHLYGLTLSKLGELNAARRALEAAHAGLPRDPTIANNLGNLLGRLNAKASALAAYDAAIAAAPGFAPAHLNRAITLGELGHFAQAREAFAALAEIEAPTANTLVAIASLERDSGHLEDAAATLDGILFEDRSNAVARNARARIALDMGEEDAADRYREALSAEPGNRDMLLGYIDAAETPHARHDALDRVARLLVAAPDWLDGHRALSTALWEDGEHGRFAASYTSALGSRPRDAMLWKGYIEALGKIDRFADAADLCREAASATGDPAFLASAFSYWSAAGEIAKAEELLALLPAGALSPLIRAKHRLRWKDPAAAEPLLAQATTNDDIEAWALRGLAWQLLGDPRFEWLNCQDGLIQVQDLPLSSTDIADIAARLRAIHLRSTARAGQSLRGGTQTGGDLLDRREPEIKMLGTVLRHAVERYRLAMPPADPRHPLLKHRDSRFVIAGSWSIRLIDGGFHVQHVHPKGMVSSASYWSLPTPMSPHGQAGWLEIGGAPAYLGLDIEPMLRIEPALGRVALFPSTLHHGTRPFPSGERMSVAFDIGVG